MGRNCALAGKRGGQKRTTDASGNRSRIGSGHMAQCELISFESVRYSRRGLLAVSGDFPKRRPVDPANRVWRRIIRARAEKARRHCRVSRARCQTSGCRAPPLNQSGMKFTGCMSTFHGGGGASIASADRFDIERVMTTMTTMTMMMMTAAHCPIFPHAAAPI